MLNVLVPRILLNGTYVLLVIDSMLYSSLTAHAARPLKSGVSIIPYRQRYLHSCPCCVCCWADGREYSCRATSGLALFCFGKRVVLCEALCSSGLRSSLPCLWSSASSR